MGSRFDRFYRYLMHTLELKPRLVPEVAGCSSKLLQAQMLLEGKQIAEAKKVLE